MRELRCLVRPAARLEFSERRVEARPWRQPELRMHRLPFGVGDCTVRQCLRVTTPAT